jgi:hypothetical protein
VLAVAASAARVFAAEENGFGTELASPCGISRGRMGRSSGAENLVFGLGRLRAPLARTPSTETVNLPEFYSSRRFTVTARDALISDEFSLTCL